MAKDKFSEATVVASPRSRAGKKTLLKLKKNKDAGAGGDAEEKLISIITDKDTNVFSDFVRCFEKQLNEHLQKEIKKKLI